MSKCRITVLKRVLNQELAREYSGRDIPPCKVFEVGQEFIAGPFGKPEGFCDWAWDDIYKTVLALSRGGDFSTGVFDNWMKDNKTMLVCCSDGIRPVVFKVERIDEEQ